MNKSMTQEMPVQQDTEQRCLHKLEKFFSPKAVAVVGASPKPGNQGRHIVESLSAQGYKGKVYTVHPDGTAVNSAPVFQNIESLPDGVDVVIAAVSAPHVLPLLEPMAAKGIHHLIVISGGFSETGPEGEGLQTRLQEEARERGIRVIGPNGLGVFSAPDRFNSFFLRPGEIHLPQAGPVGLISQSGAFMSQILDQFGERGLGVHRAVNFGNRIDVDEAELLKAFGRDPAVKVIGIYLESVADGRAFYEIARKVARFKPVVLCKGGRASRGARAAQAHSASLAGSYTVFETACRQAGILVVEGLEALVDTVHVLALQAPAQGNRVLVVSNGGGMGVLLTDLCEQAGLQVPETSQVYQNKLRTLFPKYYSFHNPIDLTGSGTNEQCALIVEHLMQTREFDALLLVLLSGTEGITERFADFIARLPDRSIPIVMGVYGRSMFQSMRETLTQQGIPVFRTGERAARAVKALVEAGCVQRPEYRFPQYREHRFNSFPTRDWLKGVTETPHEMRLKELLSQCNVSIPQHMHAPNRHKAEEAVHTLHFPLVLKVAGPGIQHKTELKGIEYDLKDEKNFMAAWHRMNRIWPGHIWAEQQIPPGLDLMVGAYRDPDFGPILLFGTGGEYVEVYEDIARLLVPASDSELYAMIRRTRAGRIMEGLRGRPQLDVDRVVDLLQWIADWIRHETRIQALDLNPVRLFKHDMVVLDAKITMTTQDGKG